MSGLWASLKEFDRTLILAVPQKPFKLEKAAIEIRRELAAITPREPARYDLIETYENIVTALKSDVGLQSVPSKHLKRAPWVMFDSISEMRNPLPKSTGLCLHSSRS